MVREIAIIGAVLIAVSGWNMLASAILCFGVRHRELLAFPYLQWIEAASLFRVADWQVKIWIFTAAMLASVAVMVGVIALVPSRRPAKQPLYGASQWATEQQMYTSGVRRERSPF